MSDRRVEVCGVGVDCVDFGAAIARVDQLLRTGQRGAIFAINPEKIVGAERDPRLKQALTSAALLVPDGIGVVLAVRLLHRRAIARVPGCELMPALCAYAAREGRSVFLFGGAPGIAERAGEVLKRNYPGLVIVGTQHGFLDEQGTAALTARINASRPDFLFVALGSPRQEYWIADRLGGLDVKICQGVGGTFDVLAGTVKRAPETFRRFQLEWLYRLLSEPKRAARQAALPVFAGRVLREYAARRAGNRGIQSA